MYACFLIRVIKIKIYIPIDWKLPIGSGVYDFHPTPPPPIPREGKQWNILIPIKSL